LKGGNRSRWLRKKGKQQKEKRRKERGIEARRLINDFGKSFEVTIPNFNPGGEFVFLPVFYWLNG
jgi:hypothetical protein